MTHHTDAERAEFEDGAWYWVEKEGWFGEPPTIAPACYKAGSDAWHSVAFSGIPTREVKVLEPCRRAPAAPVPQGVLEAAQRAHDWMDSQADSQSKGNFHSFDLLCLRQERDALAEALAAAPQPPEAAPVPQFSRIAQKKLDYLLEAGEAITGYAIENKDGRRGAIDCHGFVYWWQDAAAPQQLANHDIQEQST